MSSQNNSSNETYCNGEPDPYQSYSDELTVMASDLEDELQRSQREQADPAPQDAPSNGGADQEQKGTENTGT